MIGALAGIYIAGKTKGMKAIYRDKYKSDIEIDRNSVYENKLGL
jgi:hypothetical protein